MTMKPALDRDGAPDRLRPLVAVSLVAALLAYVGCSPKPGDSLSPTPTAGPEAAKVVAKLEPGEKTTEQGKDKPAPDKPTPPPAPRLFVDWPTPTGALVISGEQLGYLEPCGCTQGQLGGLLRRYDFVERLRGERKWPLVQVDLGSLIKDPSLARGGPEQTKIKFNTALKALAVMNYDALALSPEDLKVGVDEAVGQFLNLPGDRPKVVSANVAAPGLEAKIVPSIRASAGPLKVGITAVADPGALKALKDPSLDLLAVKSIDETLPAVLAGLEKDTDTQVLLVQGSPELAKTLAEKYKGFDIVVATSTGADPEADATPLNGGKTLLVNVGQKGKYVGVVGLFREGGPKYRYQRVMLGTHLDGPATAMKKVIEDDFRESLKQQKVVENFPRHGFVNAAGGASGATFVGAETCKNCHPKTVEFWGSTKHAKAFESLVHDPKPNTMFDAECVACHTTGFEYTSGWKSPELTSKLKGNQCENCHGPASKHVADPTNKAVRAPLRLTSEQADKNRLCLKCHDEDNSPHFEFAKYWGEIEHNGLDNPREHLKKPQKVASEGGR
jgi:hypothetical protein